MQALSGIFLNKSAFSTANGGIGIRIFFARKKHGFQTITAIKKGIGFYLLHIKNMALSSVIKMCEKR